ncbi:putative signaling protein [Actinoplanes sp. SE50]|uniref:diguanylate cyclase n=1 Tax=unclassified Actinoplanes TaxID=2626549 RepID=UPI00023ECC0C|nr:MULTISPECIES: diguanylate cyclase [unclassified Actinoplanes]AEV81557.1 putative signaling protein [Actinoplanes sp. SE50/110]ATO79959.1 putative signaling protein [Actinoplanes sp. SE50]SLL97361.1 putative signaling protein [Actinoplanes sp. SE50/110]
MTEARRTDRSPAPATVAALAAELDELTRNRGSDIAVALPRLLKVEQCAAEMGEDILKWRATLLRADLTDRTGDFAAAARLSWQALQWGTEHGCAQVVSRAHELIGRGSRTMGDPLKNLDHMLQAVEALDDTVPKSAYLGILVKLADALAETGSMPEARQRYEAAARLALEVGDVERQAMIYNNWAHGEYEAGCPDDARTAVDRLLAFNTATGRALDCCDLDTVARIRLLLGEHRAAEEAARAALDAYRESDKVEADREAELLLTVAVTQRHQGDLAGAQVSLDLSRSFCDDLNLGLLAALVQREQSEIHAAAGRWEQAYRALRAHQEIETKRADAQREAQARNRQVMFGLSEARRQAESFREQARRDPLTGLHNRRHMDEQLPGLLAEAARTGAPITAAVLDLDHFKRINDTLSHEAGDTVLSRLAARLSQVPLGDDGLAVRLGGEEFLLVITGVRPAEAIFRLEDLRRDIAEESWATITGDLPVTVSIGVTTSDAGSTVNGLLGRADAALYEAKHGGRNQVRVDPGCDLTERRWFRSLR